jgi:AdoMet-dependent rRNA methyltransferase SPB1
MLDKKKRIDIIDSSYNRYAFNDRGPSWFEEDEILHMKPIPQITKEDVEREKIKMKELNEKPLKKEMEYLIRKKKRSAENIKRVQEEANRISDNYEMSPLEKQKALQKLYKSLEKKKPRTVYVVSRKGKQMDGVKFDKGAKVKYVDKRGKADLRETKGNKKRKRSQK